MPALSRALGYSAAASGSTAASATPALVRALAELIEGGALPALVRCGVDGNPAGEEATRTLKRALRARERAAQDGALEAPTAHRLAPGTGTAAVTRH